MTRRDPKTERTLDAIARLVDGWSNTWTATARQDHVVVRHAGIGGWNDIEQSACRIALYVRHNLDLQVLAEPDGSTIRVRIA